MLARLRKLVTRHSFLVTLAAASPALAQQGPPRVPQRGAALLAPRPLEPGDPQPIARGAVDDLPPYSSTPVARLPAPPPNRLSGPAWLNDGYVQPAVGQTPTRQPTRVQPATDFTPPPAPPPQNPTSAVARGVDKIKTFVGGERPQEPGAFPAGREPPAPNAPFRGTGPNGAPVYAGPPAWRWYGYGTVTPGMNPLAPTGQYPKASANWYSVTAATPGAVPVPVMNPYRPTPGSEPPGYLTEPVARTSRPYSPTAYPQPVPPAGFPTGPPPAGVSKFGPTPDPIERSKFEPPAADTPKLLPPPATPLAPARVPPTPPPAVGVPTLTPPPAVPLPAVSSAEPMAPTMGSLPVKPTEPMVPLPPIPVAPPVVQAETPAAAPGPKALADAAVFGTSLTATKPTDVPEVPAPPAAPPGGDVNWQSTPHRVVPLETWGPANGTAAPPAPLPPPATDHGWQPGASVRPAPPVARAAAPERARPNPVADLLGEMCRGRAKDLDIRWTGSRRLTVCFEVRTEQDAGRLVKEMCARPELRPYAIDFCVLVK